MMVHKESVPFERKFDALMTWSKQDPRFFYDIAKTSSSSRLNSQ